MCLKHECARLHSLCQAHTVCFVQTYEEIESEFGRWVRDQRKEARISQAELAARSGLPIDASAISRIESGDRSVRLSEAVAIAGALDQQILPSGLLDRADPVRRLVEETIFAVEEMDRADLAYVVSADRLHAAMAAGSETMERLEKVVSDFDALEHSLQKWVLLKIEGFRRRGGQWRELYERALSAANPQVRESLGGTDGKATDAAE